MPRVPARILVRQSILACEQLEARLCLSGVSFLPHLIESGDPVARRPAPRPLLGADFDMDGDVDILTAFYIQGGSGVGLYENMDGKGTFGEHRELVIGLDSLGGGQAADLDGDGDNDIALLSTDPMRNAVTWYENLDGAKSFVERQTLPTIFWNVLPLYAVDTDKDGDVDILRECVWNENIDGEGTFASNGRLAVPGGAKCRFADFDGDGDLDILTFSDYSTGDRGGLDLARDGFIRWEENISGPGTFVERQVLDEFGYFGGDTADVDGDGDTDIVALNGRNVASGLGWYENSDGKGMFAEKQVFGRGGRHHVHALDMDGDGDADILANINRNARFQPVWYKNTDGLGTFAETRYLDAFRPIDSAVDRFVDIDGDGDIDVLERSDSDLFWHEQVQLPPGDADRDLAFNQLDIVLVQQAATYLSGEPATWEEGDWNGDGVFDERDLDAALATGNYLEGPYVDAALTEPGE